MAEKLTLRGYGEASFTEKRSEFIGYAAPVENEAEAIEFIKSIKKKHPDARHNCSAYVIGDLSRYSDDGEPQGSAGMPILNTIKKSGIDSAAVVVTRYFGGILLGTGGLVRAYSKASVMALEAAGRLVLEEMVLLSAECGYNDYQAILRELAKFCASVKESDFAENVAVTLTVPEKYADGLAARIFDMTSGRVKVAEIGREYGEKISK